MGGVSSVRDTHQSGRLKRASAASQQYRHPQPVGAGGGIAAGDCQIKLAIAIKVPRGQPGGSNPGNIVNMGPESSVAVSEQDGNGPLGVGRAMVQNRQIKSSV